MCNGLIDIDNHLILGAKDEPNSTKIIYNELLLAELKKYNITNIYLLTTLDLGNIESNYSMSFTKLKEIQTYLQEKGFLVKSIITASDLNYQRGLGFAYNQMVTPANEEQPSNQTRGNSAHSEELLTNNGLIEVKEQVHEIISESVLKKELFNYFVECVSPNITSVLCFIDRKVAVGTQTNIELSFCDVFPLQEPLSDLKLQKIQTGIYKKTIKKYLKLPEIKGSPNEMIAIATIMSILLFVPSNMTTPAIAGIQGLSDSKKFSLVISPILTGSALTIPVGVTIDKNGGVNLIRLLRALSILGNIGFTTLVTTSDISTITDGDSRYYLLLASNIFSGLTAATYATVTIPMMWNPKRSSGYIQAVYSGVALIMMALSQFAIQLGIDNFGMLPTYALLTTLVTIGNLITCLLIKAPPYQQYLEAGFDDTLSRLFAEAYGQEQFSKKPEIGYLRDFLKTLKDPRAFVISLAVFISAGGAYAISAIMPIILNSLLNVPSSEAVKSIAIISMGANLIRIISGKLLDKFDPTHGIATHTFATSFLVATGGLMLAIPRPIPSIRYALTGVSFLSAGLSTAASASFKQVSEMASGNSRLSSYNIGTMGSIVSASGGLASLAFSLIFSVFFSLQGTKGYSSGFFVIVAIAVFANFSLLAMSRYLKQPNSSQLNRNRFLPARYQPEVEMASVFPR